MNITTILLLVGVISAGALIGMLAPVQAPVPAVAIPATTYSICHTGGGTNCAVDGDPAWIGGVKVRIAAIDATKTHPSHCPSEADLGDRATRRLADLMNAVPFEMRPVDRNQDRYGRKFRILARGRQSVGDALVNEGLARP